MRRRQVIRRRERVSVRAWLLLFFLGILLVTLVIWFVRGSSVLGRGRFNLVMVGEGRTSFVSFDKEEETVMAIAYPPELEIRSRSEGKYTLAKLYTLGKYTGNAGEFARVKVQGFMKTLVQGYLVYPGEMSKLNLTKALLVSMVAGEGRTNLALLDKLILFGRVMSYDLVTIDTTVLEREGIIVPGENGALSYNEDRLQQFVAGRVFDWRLGNSGILAAVVNESQETRLAGDVAKFLENSGIDVVAVRNGEATREQTEVVVANEELVAELAPLIESFGWSKVTTGDTSEWRASVVVKLGKDALELF